MIWGLSFRLHPMEKNPVEIFRTSCVAGQLDTYQSGSLTAAEDRSSPQGSSGLSRTFEGVIPQASGGRGGVQTASKDTLEAVHWAPVASTSQQIQMQR